MDGALTDLEFLIETDVPVAIPDGVGRCIIVVVKRTEGCRGITVEDVVHPNRELRAPEHPLPDAAVVLDSGDLAHRVLPILRVLRVAGRSSCHFRLQELVS